MSFEGFYTVRFEEIKFINIFVKLVFVMHQKQILINFCNFFKITKSFNWRLKVDMWKFIHNFRLTKIIKCSRKLFDSFVWFLNSTPSLYSATKEYIPETDQTNFTKFITKEREELREKEERIEERQEKGKEKWVLFALTFFLYCILYDYMYIRVSQKKDSEIAVKWWVR